MPALASDPLDLPLAKRQKRVLNEKDQVSNQRGAGSKIFAPFRVSSSSTLDPSFGDSAKRDFPLFSKDSRIGFTHTSAIYKCAPGKIDFSDHDIRGSYPANLRSATGIKLDLLESTTNSGDHHGDLCLAG